MNTNINTWIEDYLRGNLSEAERKLFEDKLKTDTDFAEEFELNKRIENAIANDEIDNFRETLKNIHKKLYNESETEISGTKKLFNTALKYWKIAAVVLIILIPLTVVMYIMIHDSSSNSNLFYQNYERYPAISENRSINKIINDSIFSEGLKCYKNGDFTNAVGYFKNVVENEDNNVAAQFFLGISYIEITNYNRAINSFEDVIEKDDTLYSQQSEWYLALCLIKIGKTNDAKSVLQRIIDNEGYYFSKAGKLLNEID
ncbi:MAG: tetratricopeptide repeat protein [Bacteroidales bacterium]|nr:tetratricopeptide repeat protein [Bacteroidales bacterium]